MERLQRWFGTRPFGGFQPRLFLYLFCIGAIPVLSALAFLYMRDSESSEREWRANVAYKHELAQRRIDGEIRELDFQYRLWLQDESVRSLVHAAREDRLAQQEALQAAEAHIIDKAAFLAQYRKYAQDVCIAVEEAGPFCVKSSPFEYESAPTRVPINRSDVYVRDEGGGRVAWVGPLFDPNSYVVVGYVKLVMNMALLLDDIRDEAGLSDLAVWDMASGSVVLESGSRRIGSSGGPAAMDSGADAYVRSEGDFFLSRRPLDVPGQNWISYLEMPATDAISRRASLRHTVVAFLAILLVVSAAGSLLFSALFSRPLHALRRLMKRAESGDLKAYWTPGSIREIDELGASYNQMLNRLEETIKQVKQEESLKKEAEIEALHYQLNPHFLYNTLNTIKWVAKIHKTPQIADAVTALVRLLQASLGKKGDFLTLKEEVELIRNYMAIQSFRYGDRVRLILDIDPVALVCLMPKMMLQPLVENALIHGLVDSAGDGEIAIRAWLDRDMLLCEVQDNGKGMADPETALGTKPAAKGAMERMSGIGLRHIREKIKLYYGPDYKMHVFSKPNEGTVVRLSLPIHRSEES